MAETKSAEFVEHFYFDKYFVTDIWYLPSTGRYHSIVTDLCHETFTDLDGIRAALTQIKREALNHGRKKES